MKAIKFLTPKLARKMNQFEAIFSKPERTIRAFQHLLWIRSDIPEKDRFREKDYDALLRKVAYFLCNPTCSDVPLTWLVKSLRELWVVYAHQESEWKQAIDSLVNVFKITADERIAQEILEFLPEIYKVYPSTLLSFHPLGAVVSKIDSLSNSSLTTSSILAVTELLKCIPHTENVVPQAEQMVPILLNIIDNRSECEPSTKLAAAECLEVLVICYLNYPSGVQYVAQSEIIPSLLIHLENMSQVEMPSTTMFRVLIRIISHSTPLRKAVVDCGISNVLRCVMRELGTKTQRGKRLEHVAYLSRFVAREAKHLPHEVCFVFAKDIIQGLLNLNGCSISSRTTHEALLTMQELVCNVSNDISRALLQSNPIMSFMVAHLHYSTDYGCVEKVLEMLLSLFRKFHTYTTTSRFIEEGGLVGLNRVALQFPSLHPIIHEIHNVISEEFENRLTPWVEKLQKDMSNENEPETSVVQILKYICKNNSAAYDIGISSYEIMESGLLDVLLNYFFDDPFLKNANKEGRLLAMSSALKLSPILQECPLTARITSFLRRCMEMGEDLTILLGSFVDSLIHVFFFMASKEFHHDGNPCSKEQAENQEILNKMPCVLHKVDVRHELFLLLGVLYQAARFAPVFDAQHAANLISAYPDRSSIQYAIKEFKPIAIPAEEFHINDLILVVSGIVEHDSCLINTPCFVETMRFCSFALPSNLKKSILERQICYSDDIYLDRQSVDRDNLLKSAKKVLESHAKLYLAQNSRVQLHVTFQDKSSAAEFYSLLCHEISDPDNGMWRMSSGLGLFPMSYEHPPQSILGNFSMLGHMMATALRDGQLLDLHLSMAFYKSAIFEQPLLAYDILPFSSEIGSIMIELSALQSRKNTIKYFAKRRKMVGINPEENLTFRGSDLTELSMPYEVPGAEKYKLSRGSNEILSLENLDCYLDEALDTMLNSGVMMQIEAFRKAFNQILPIKFLRMFAPEEMEILLCKKRCNNK